MPKDDWDAPKTEEGLRQVLRRLEECRTAGDLIETGNGLLQLEFLVKWVRSDTNAPPFVRAHELALEALEVFRQAGDIKGQIRSLVTATSMSAPLTREKMLSEAEHLSEELGDENYVAMVLAARARALAMSDMKKAAELHRRVLEIYRRTGNLQGQANCLFSLAIADGTSEEKRDMALEGAQLNRSLGNHEQAAKCMTIAFRNAEEIVPLANLEDLAKVGLQDALTGGSRNSEGHFYTKLSHIYDAKGNTEEAEKYRRWAQDIESSDGRTPRERWKDDIEMTKMMIATSKTHGNKEAVKLFQEELKRLKSSKPKS